MKRYDRAYFDRFYRGPDARLTPESLARNVALAVAVAESVLDRPLESVLDVGCGEGRWQPVLQEMRPEAVYLGIDSSEYAVERFGEERNLLGGSFHELESFAFEEPFDLVICSDVLHYLDKETILMGMDTLVDLVGGVALLEVFTGAGLVPVGLQFYVHHEIAEGLDALDLQARR
ncbi:MAG TPA: class I SAM-dependent methyltransferase [Longimicrobiales bacterium]|nr:class I SAM-dependent methyltransferase [Longimicrobiales bacterium]